MPKLWTDTIETHRQELRQAVLDTTARLITEHGLLAVTMSRIAAEAGIGRATLYKYFPDVESILLAWHERQVAAHLMQLIEVRDAAREPGQRLHAVLETYAFIINEAHRPHDNEIATSLHSAEHVHRGEQQLRQLVQDLLVEAINAGEIRDDVPPDELAGYCLHALAAASTLPSKAAVRRLVAVTLNGLQPVT